MKVPTARWFVLAAMSLLSSAAHANHVVVLQQESEPAIATAHSTIAELALAGFTVSVQRLESHSDSEMLEELALVARQPGVIAGVNVERRDDTSVGYLWLRGAKAPVVVQERADQAVIAHSVVVLKLTELLREHRLSLPANEGFEVAEIQPLPQQPASSRVRAEAPAVTTPVSSELALRTWLGAGLATLPFGSGFAWQLAASGELAFTRRLSLLAAASFPLSAHQHTSEMGTAQIRATDVVGGLQVALLSLGHFDLSVGPRVGLKFLAASASSTAEYQAQRSNARVVTFGVELRGTYRVASALLLSALIRPEWMTPQPRLTNGAREVVKLGSVSSAGLLMLGWELGL
jgi:hypothetical protein